MTKLKQTLSIVLLVILPILLSNCSFSTKSESVTLCENGVIDINVTKALEDAREFKLSEIVADVEFVTLESTVESFFSFPSKIQVTENYIFVFGMVNKHILLFDRKGKFIRRIGQLGKGPGEYISGTTASINPKEEYIIVVDGNGGKLLKYDLQGNCLKQNSYRTDFPNRIDSDLIFLENDNFAIATARPPVPIDNYHRVLVFDKELNFQKKLLPIPNNDSLCLNYLNSPFLSSGYNMEYYFEGFTDTIYSISPIEKPTPKYHFTIDQNRYTLDFMTRKDRSKKPKDFTYVRIAYDLPKHLIFFTMSLDEPYQMIYDKKKKLAFSPTNDYSCDTTSYKGDLSHKITNDLFGYHSIGFKHYSPNLNILVNSISLEIASSEIDLECLRNKKVLFPKERDQLADMIENYAGEELPVLAIMKLK